MILGRPTNLWLAAATAVWGIATVALHVDPVLAGLVTTAMGAVIGLIAGQPPTLQPGDTYSIQTPKGSPNYEATVATPPAPTKPEPAA